MFTRINTNIDILLSVKSSLRLNRLRNDTLSFMGVKETFDYEFSMNNQGERYGEKSGIGPRYFILFKDSRGIDYSRETPFVLSNSDSKIGTVNGRRSNLVGTEISVDSRKRKEIRNQYVTTLLVTQKRGSVRSLLRKFDLFLHGTV